MLRVTSRELLLLKMHREDIVIKHLFRGYYIAKKRKRFLVRLLKLI
nr:MAG TPA: hypothetical protein [Caudoviricetes sp.]